MAIRHIALAVISTALTACSMPFAEQHQQTIAAINQVETNVARDVANLTTYFATQEQHMQQLESEIATLNQTVDTLRKTQQTLTKKMNTKPPEPEIIYIEKPVTQQPAAPLKNTKATLGEIEWVWIENTQANYRARVDTGATTSSLNAKDIQEFERDGKTWVRFTLEHTQTEDGSPIVAEKIEAPVKRWVKIRQAAADELERRPVIELRLRLGELNEKAQFTLADRSQMEFPLLLGREFFKDLAVVDVSQSYLHPKYVQSTVSASSSVTPVTHSSTASLRNP